MKKINHRKLIGRALIGAPISASIAGLYYLLIRECGWIPVVLGTSLALLYIACMAIGSYLVTHE